MWRKFPTRLLGYMHTDYVGDKFFGIVTANETPDTQTAASMYFLRPPSAADTAEERVFIPATAFSPVTDAVWPKLDTTSTRAYLHFAYGEGKAFVNLARGDGDGKVPLGWTTVRIELVFSSPSLGNCRWRVSVADEPASFTAAWAGSPLTSNVAVAVVDTVQTSSVPNIAVDPNSFSVSGSARLYLQVWHNVSDGANTVLTPVAFLGAWVVRA